MKKKSAFTDDLMMLALDAGADDFNEEDDYALPLLPFSTILF